MCDKTCDKCDNLDFSTGHCKKCKGEGYENLALALHSCMELDMKLWEPIAECQPQRVAA